MHSCTRKFFTGLVAFLLVVVCEPAYAQEDYNNLCRELEVAGFKISESGVAYGVPFVKIKIPLGFSITSLCERIPSFNREFARCRNRIAFFNALNPNYVKTATDEPYSIEAGSLKIPLDFRKVPEIFPDFDASLANYKQYLLVDIGKSFLALYERGTLTRVFPISSGAPGERTPLFDFQVEGKDKDHFSSIYGSWMPWALHIKGPYYIHGGVLPGKRDSAGCIRLPIHDAKQLFALVKVGAPGRIIDTPKVQENIYPAPFCR
jgi:hypothetical protein